MSAVADPATGMAVFDSFTHMGASGWLVFGGTSAATPIVAGIAALSGGRSPGTTRGRFGYDHPSAFNDITTGSNGTCAAHPHYCTAGLGYDGPTGIGTPVGADDLIAPDQPVLAQPAAPLATNQTSLAVSGTAEPGATVTVLDGAVSTATPVASGAGAWSATLTLAEGDHPLSVTATDGAGNVSTASPVRTVTVDTLAPETSIIAGPEGTAAQRDVAFALAASESATFSCRLDGPGALGAWRACGSQPSYSGLADGAYTLQARAGDGAGNTDPTPATRAFTVDAPAAPADAVLEHDPEPAAQALLGGAIVRVAGSSAGPCRIYRRAGRLRRGTPRLAVGCRTAARVRVTATLRLPGRARGRRLTLRPSGLVAVAAGRSVGVRLRPTRAQRSRVRRARRVPLVLALSVRDAAGRSARARAQLTMRG